MRAPVVLIALGLVACNPAEGSTDASGNSVLPEGVSADYGVSISLGDTSASFSAQFYKGPDPITGTTIFFSGGETLAVNSAELSRSTFAGLAGYYGSGPLVDPGSNYAFVLSVPGKGTFSTLIPMVGTGHLSAPTANATVSATKALVVTWQSTDASATPSVVATFQASGGSTATSTATAAAGETTVTFSSAELKSLRQQAAGSAGGPVVGTLVLKLGQEVTPEGFLGGSATIDREVDSVGISLTP